MVEATVTPADLFILWQGGAICTMIVVVGLNLSGTFSFRGHAFGPVGNGVAMVAIAFLWFVSVPVLVLLGEWEFS
jgi:hypothetical protein